MSVTCPSCERGMDATALNAAAQTGVCTTCGDVRPKVEPAGGRVFDWVITWDGNDRRPSLVALQTATPFRAPLFVACGLLLLLLAAVLDAKEMSLGPRFLCVLLGAVTLLLSVAARRPAIRLTRGRFEWSTALRSRSAFTDDLVGFCVEKREETEGAVSWVLAARVGPRGLVALSSAPSHREVQLLCDVLNEALFVVKAAPQLTSGPYR